MRAGTFLELERASYGTISPPVNMMRNDEKSHVSNAAQNPYQLMVELWALYAQNSYQLMVEYWAGGVEPEEANRA